MWLAQLLLVLVGALLSLTAGQNTNEEEAILWLEELNVEYMVEGYLVVLASWNYNTNITDETLQAQIEAFDRFAEFQKAVYDEAMGFAWEDFTEPTKRQFEKVTDIGTAVLPPDEFSELSQLEAEMQRMYSVAQVCNRPGYDPAECFPLDPDLTEIIATSRDWDELVWAWQGWRDKSSVQMRPLYVDTVNLQNKAAVTNGFEDNGDYWRSWYETPTFEEDCLELWNTVKPLYEQLHAYVRRKLQEVYPEHEFPASGHIPAHLLGNMWGQSWNFIEDIVRPYPDKPGFDVTEEMINQGYTPLRMFELSEDFFTSLGLIEMPEPFWEHTMMERPDDREVVCHASAWDFRNQIDFRVKQCTEVNHDWLLTTHHEMGHIEYFLQYMNQPVWYRDGANPGFHEAIGDVMSLSVNTPEHLIKIDLLPEFEDDEESDINFLMSQALQKIAFLPFGYLIDQWRWSVYDGQIPSDNYNAGWWDFRCRHQGLSPPVTRSEADFDPGSKFHVPAGVPYIRYFVSYIVQFQFHEALCAAANNAQPLHRCDIYESAEAGQLISEMMQLGSSLPWPDAMEAITGSRDMDAQSLVDYFQPLLDWLTEQNAGHPVGWEDRC